MVGRISPSAARQPRLATPLQKSLSAQLFESAKKAAFVFVKVILSVGTLGLYPLALYYWEERKTEHLRQEGTQLDSELTRIRAITPRSLRQLEAQRDQLRLRTANLSRDIARMQSGRDPAADPEFRREARHAEQAEADLRQTRQRLDEEARRLENRRNNHQRRLNERMQALQGNRDYLNVLTDPSQPLGRHQDPVVQRLVRECDSLNQMANQIEANNEELQERAGNLQRELQAIEPQINGVEMERGEAATNLQTVRADIRFRQNYTDSSAVEEVQRLEQNRDNLRNRQSFARGVTAIAERYPGNGEPTVIYGAVKRATLINRLNTAWRQYCAGRDSENRMLQIRARQMHYPSVINALDELNRGSGSPLGALDRGAIETRADDDQNWLERAVEQLRASVSDEERVYKDRFGECRSMPELIETAVRSISEGELLNMDSSIYHINRSDEIATGAEQENQRFALVNFVVMQLITGASLLDREALGNCHAELQLHFNDHGLYIQNSLALRLENGNIFYQHPCEWAEAPVAGRCQEGIEPITLKRLLMRFDDNERLHLQNLILSPFISSQSGSAAHRAREARDQNPSLEMAENLLHELGASLYYSALRPQILAGIEAVFNDQTLRAFREDQENSFQETNEPAVAWTPQYHLMPQALVRTVQKFQRVVRTYWADRRGLPEAPVQSGAFISMPQLQEQYHCKHNYNIQGCLIDSLAALLFMKKPSRDEVALLMQGMGAYVRSRRQDFEQRVEAQHRGVGFDDYCRWLSDQIAYPGELDENRHPFLGDLEIELFSGLIGVGVEQFQADLPVTVDSRGMLRSPARIGRNTEERLFLFTSSRTHRALVPRLDPGQDSEDSEEATRALQEFANQIDDQQDFEQRFQQGRHALPGHLFR